MTKQDVQIEQAYIDELIEGLEGLRYDSIIIVFGIDQGQYMDALKQVICPNNKVILIEPNEEIYADVKQYEEENIHIVLYEKQQIQTLLYQVVNFLNYNHIYWHAYGNYSKVYNLELQELLDVMRKVYFNASACLSLAYRFREKFIDNMISNLYQLNKATPLNEYVGLNKGIPALVVSAGPSLDRQLQTLIKYRDQLQDYFIITGSRTVGALVDKGIRPDLIVSVDPVDANYEMMKDYLDLDVPLAFYEYSNDRLVNEYKGSKIYIASLFSQTINELRTIRGAYLGGSVAHACVDIAYMLGCNPIILLGQDLAYTDGKHHSVVATYDHDRDINAGCNLVVKDIAGNYIQTTVTLNYFRENMEAYISKRKQQEAIEFINTSYGAAIEGAPFEPLEDVMKRLEVTGQKVPCYEMADITIDAKGVIASMYDYINEWIGNAQDGIVICQEIIEDGQIKKLDELPADDIDLQKILYILNLVEIFERSKEQVYLGGYCNKFMYEIKNNIFNKLAKDFQVFSSDLQHQATSFKVYFEELYNMLEEVKGRMDKVVTKYDN